MRVNRFFIAFLLLVLFFSLIVGFLTHHQFKESRLYLLTQIALSLGTLTVIILSIYGNGIFRYFNPPEVELASINNDGDILLYKKTDGSPDSSQIVYHLSVINRNTTISLKNCTVLLRRIRIVTVDKKEIIADKRLIAPYSFKWALMWDQVKDKQKFKDISHDEILNFITIHYERKRIHPNLVDYFRDFDSFFSSEHYILQMDLEFRSMELQHQASFEIKLKCKWHDDLETIKSNVEISRIPRLS